MTVAMKGLRLHPRYEELIGVAVSGELYNIKFPNRDAKFLREGFVLSQLDGEGARIMEKQQEQASQASKEAYKEHLLKQVAKIQVLISMIEEIMHIKKCEQNELSMQCILIFPGMM